MSDELESSALTIGMPVRNGGAFIGRALQSLLNQDYSPIDIVVSDNASTDSTETICADICKENPRVQYIRRETPVPAIENFWLTLQDCKTPFFMWAAHDDEWNNSWVSTLLPAIRGSAIGAFGKLFQIDADGVILSDHPAHGSVMKYVDIDTQKLRLAKFLMKREANGKANLIYSIFRTEQLRMALESARARDIDFDCAIVFLVLQHGRIASEPSAVFKKRIQSGLTKPTTVSIPTIRLSVFSRLMSRAWNEREYRTQLKREWKCMMQQYVSASLPSHRRFVAILVWTKHFQNPYLLINQVRSRLLGK